MNRRQAIAILALLGALDSTYLLLHKLGIIGGLACPTGGGCDVVNTSPYSSLLGIPVAGIGLAGYAAILAVALVGVQPRWWGDARPDGALILLAGPGAAFSIYLTYTSMFVIGTACPWCLVSLALVITILALALWGALAARRAVVGGT